MPPGCSGSNVNSFMPLSQIKEYSITIKEPLTTAAIRLKTTAQRAHPSQPAAISSYRVRFNFR
jgi:hypothetical protein